MNVIPAYGRDYKSKAEVQADFDSGKDFRICDISSPHDGAYVNKAQLRDGDLVNVRYAKHRKVCVIKVKTEALVK